MAAVNGVIYTCSDSFFGHNYTYHKKNSCLSSPLTLEYFWFKLVIASIVLCCLFTHHCCKSDLLNHLLSYLVCQR